MARILVACEYSGRVREAFKALGHDAWSCDILDTEIPGQHYKGDVRRLLDQHWDLLIGHPECTYITNAGVRHLYENVKSVNGRRAKVYGKARMIQMEIACEFFLRLLNSKIPHICIENPIPHCYAKAIIGPYTQLIQPWMFGHKETKATCLWLRGLPKLVPTDIIKPPKHMTQEQKREWHKVHYMGPSKDRAKNRSRTYTGIATAMAEQWSPLL